MDDRTLLEKAARAAGLEGWTYKESWKAMRSPAIQTDCGPCHSFWDPLTDDGDALRLAVKIGMEFAADDEATHCAFAYARVRGAGDSHIFEPVVDDPCKAMRRAITRAAAAMDKGGDA